MMRLVYSIAAVLLLLCPAAAQQQALIGVGAPVVAGGSYTGPGDIVAGGWFFWAGLRAFSAAKAAAQAKIANICNVGDATCIDVNSDTSGNLNLGASGLACNNGANICTVKTLYDQGGGTCDFTMATIGTRPTIVINGVGTKPSMGFNGSQNLTGCNPGPSQPFTIIGAANRTGATTSFSDVIGWQSTGNIQFLFYNATNTFALYAGTLGATVTASDNTFHRLQGLYNGASSKIMADATLTTGLNAGNSSYTGVAQFGNGNNGLTGNVLEGGLSANDLSTNFTALDSNISTYWGI